MDYKPHALLDEPLKIHVRSSRLHESLRMYLGYLVLGVICLSVTLLAFPMRALLPRALSKRLGRRLVTHITRAYLHFLT
ncbi:MAG: 1-acyl-sn-glycerol-3-phosphate acyltransferase, partial [Polaromonas sp.]|nr:1-acyl-sn-glycerol-3-phosphate acyltransferase [Polaromonas sp.]